MKHVLIVVPDLFTPGGMQRYNRFLCDLLDREFQGTQFTIVSLSDMLRPGAGSRWKGMKFVVCAPGQWRYIRWLFCICKVLAIAVRRRPALIICGHVSMAPLACLCKRAYGIRYIVLTQGVEVWHVRGGSRYRGLSEADAILTVSRYTRDRMVANGITVGKIRILRHAADMQTFFRMTKDPRLVARWNPERKHLLLTVGRIDSGERYKGHQIMPAVLKCLGKEYVWLVVGEGDDVQRIQQSVKEAGVADQVRFAGHLRHSQLNDYYNLCDLFIMPSTGEGFGRVFLEAMACGKPVIAGNRDGSAEPLLDGRLGFLVDPENEEEIAEAVRRACRAEGEKTDPAYLRREVERHFSPEIFRIQVKDIFSKLIR